MRGQELKRYVRAAASLRDLFNDADLAREVGVSRMSVEAWWTGSQPKNPTIGKIAEATGLSISELTGFVYHGGPPPLLVWPGSPLEAGGREGIRRDQDRQPGGAPAELPLSPGRRPRDRRAGFE